jgi:hypothetical protein
MRARTFRPFVDHLDLRIVCDASAAAVVADVSTTTASMPGDEVDLTTGADDGDSSDNSDDPMNPPIVASTPTYNS